MCLIPGQSSAGSQQIVSCVGIGSESVGSEASDPWKAPSFVRYDWFKYITDRSVFECKKSAPLNIKIKEALEIPDQLARKPFPTISLELEMGIKAVGSIFLI